jgi:hypothetical protein
LEFDVPAFDGSIRLGMQRTGSFTATEYFILDNVSIVAVPEPAALQLVALGLSGVAAMACWGGRRRKRDPLSRAGLR